jgi:phosphate:Na+ symporter
LIGVVGATVQLAAATVWLATRRRAGLLPASTMVTWVLGANLGITLTMMMAGWGSVEDRRLATRSFPKTSPLLLK